MKRRIRNAKITHVSLCQAGKNKLPVLYKADGKDRVRFESLAKATDKFDDQGELLTVVYAPEHRDVDGDIASAEAIKKMAYSFARDGQGLDIEHDGKVLPREDAYVAESFLIAKGDERFADWPFSESPLLIQGFSSGPRHTYYFLAHEGEVVAGVDTKILRTDRANGTGFAVESISVKPTESVVQASRKFLRHFDYSGLGCAQFLMGEEGRIDTFLEINPRLGAAHALSHTCGVDFPRMAVELALGEALRPMPDPSDYAVGVRFGWLYGDILALQKARAAKEITAAGAVAWLWRLFMTFVRARSHPTWSIEDPLPTLFIYSNSVLSMFKGALLGVVATLLVGVAVWLTVVYTGAYDVAASDPHADIVRWTLDKTMRRSVASRADEVQLPESFSQQVVAEGGRHYAEGCAHCHGAPGEDPAEWSRGMRPEPPHLVDVAPEWSTEEIYWIIEHGIKLSGMPAFGEHHGPEELTAIAAFVSQLPGLSPEDYASMVDGPTAMVGGEE